MKEFQLSRLVDMEDPQAILDEVKHIVSMLFSDFDCAMLDRVFTDIVRLFRGKYPGYAACQTQYHDLKHTTDTFLAMARLIHGAMLKGANFTREQVLLGLLCALMHDTGYIPRLDDEANKTMPRGLTDIGRSIAFTERYCSDNDLPAQIFKHSSAIVTCTDLSADISTIQFASGEIEMLGKLLAAADLLGQMADRTYLEKLLFLFYEFRDGGVMGYENELDLLRKTRDFYARIEERIAKDLSGVDKYMRYHFKARWNLDRDLYKQAVEKHITYLKFILRHHQKDYRKHLRRGGLVRSLQERTR
jgi:hypothetical protein